MFYKVMWFPNSRVVWNMKTEEIDEGSVAYEKQLASVFDLNDWISEFGKQYSEWLTNDSTVIFDLESKLISDIRGAVEKINKVNDENNRLFYWYDIDKRSG